MKKVSIIGAGISGLFIANLFKRNLNYQVTIYEKNNLIKLEEGYGVQLSVNSIKPISSVNLKLEAKRALDMRMDVNYFETVYGMKLPSLDDEILSVAKDYENEF